MSEPKLLTNPGGAWIDWPTEVKRKGQSLLFPVRIQVPEGQEVRIRLLNLLGKPVLQQNIKAEEAARRDIQIDLGKVPPGVLS